MSHHIIIPVAKEDWLLQNHRVHYQEAARRKKQIRYDAMIYGKRDLTPVRGPVAIYARAYVRAGTLPDADAIAPMVKAAIDGLVDARIIPNDDGEHLYLVGYGRPARDRTLKPNMRALMLVVTDQYVPF